MQISVSCVPQPYNFVKCLIFEHCGNRSKKILKFVDLMIVLVDFGKANS